MKLIRTAIPVLALALAVFGLTGCGGDGDDCESEAARPVAVRYEPAAFDAGVGPPPAPKPPAKAPAPNTAPKVPAPNATPKAPTIHTDNDCGDDD